MVKKVEEKVKEMIADATPKVQNVHITLAQDARWEAEEMLVKRGLEVRENFDGPIFQNTKGYQIGADWVAITTADDQLYIYPRTSISRIKVFYKDAE